MIHKFRAWSDVYGMSDSFGVGQSFIDIHHNGANVTLYGYMEECEVMQYTNWTNMDEVEIFVGDIVEAEREEIVDYAIKVDEKYIYRNIISRGVVVWDICDACFSIEAINPHQDGCKFYDQMGKLFCWPELKVIGNIHADKHLL
jgi:hypothetical protein